MSAEDIEYMDDYKKFPTKESALDWLDNYLNLDERNNLIKALEQEPCDAINRQAVNTLIDELARTISDERCGISRGRSTATIMWDIRHLPPVTPQQKTGENYINWISVDEDLPKSNQKVWIWYKHYEKYKYADFDKRNDYYTETYYETAKVDTYIVGEFGKTWWLNLPKDESYIGYHGEKHTITNTVLAWCPMEPYQHK